MVLTEQDRVCTGIEISQHMLELCNKNKLDVKIIRESAYSLDFHTGSFDVVFSQEVLEHLHPEDVSIHFAETFRVLRPNCILAVETPNRRTGPQDISRGFTRVAEGLHLKEWAIQELTQMFQELEFVKICDLLVLQFIARWSEAVYWLTLVPVIVKHFQDLILVLIPTLSMRTIVDKFLGLDDIFLFAKKPNSNR